jgi:hypothetical protein
MSLQASDTSGRRRAGPDSTPRLRLKPKAPTSGYVDGAWWPHTEDLPNELPGLLSALSVRLGVIARVMYNLSEWAPAPRRLPAGDGSVVRLEGLGSQPPHTLEVLGASGDRIVLLVVPASTKPDLAHSIVMAAAAVDDATGVESLLAGRSPKTTQPEPV